MRVWTNGVTHAVLSPQGLIVHGTGEPQTLPGAKLQDGFDRGLLTASPSGALLWLRYEGSVGLLARTAHRWRGTGVIAACFFDEAQVLAIAGRGHELSLARRSVESILTRPGFPPEWDTVAEYFALPTATKVKWPHAGQPGAIWKKPRYSTRTDLSLHWEVSANSHGIACVDQETGIVVCWLRGADAPSYALRVPVEYPETEIYASLTSAGVLVAHGGGRGSGGLNHFSPQGLHLGALTIDGLACPPAVTEQGFFLITERRDYSGRLDLVRHRLSDFTRVEVVEAAALATNGYLALHASEDGNVVVAGDGVKVLLFRRDAEGLLHATPLATEYAPEPVVEEVREVEPVVPALPKRVRHKTFGEGVVVSSAGEGDGLKYHVEFDSVGPKVLLARFVERLA